MTGVREYLNKFFGRKEMEMPIKGNDFIASKPYYPQASPYIACGYIDLAVEMHNNAKKHGVTNKEYDGVLMRCCELLGVSDKEFCSSERIRSTVMEKMREPLEKLKQLKAQEKQRIQ